MGDEILYAAVSVDATVKAEVQLRDFMQTLTMTFSHLTTGLAVFDRQRRLSMQNAERDTAGKGDQRHNDKQLSLHVFWIRALSPGDAGGGLLATSQYPTGARGQPDTR